MRSKPCVCEGSNENCMYCGGRGFLGSIAPAKSSNSIQATEPAQGLKLGSRRSEILEKMIRMLNPLEPRSTAIKRLPTMHEVEPRVAGTQAVVTIQRIPPPGNRSVQDLAGILSIGATFKHSSWRQRNREVCRFCLRPVKLDGGTEQHLLKCTAISGLPQQPDLMNIGKIPPPRPAPARTPPQPAYVDRNPLQAGKSTYTISRTNDFALCERCGAKVKQKNLKSHLRRVHNGGKESSSMNRAARSSGRKLLGREEMFKETFAQVNSLERRDKTRPYAHAFRENGRYGSHPIHDGFDDESGPE